MHVMRARYAAAAAAAALCALAPFGAARADQKTVLLDDLPDRLGQFEVSPDGGRLYFAAGSAFLVFDAEGRLVDRYGAPTATRELVPLPGGWFLAALTHARGQLASYRPDGTLAKTLVGRGNRPQQLRADMTGWTSPTGLAVDAAAGRAFAVDTTMAPRDDRNLPDPDWSRIAVFDLEGKYLGEINAYSAYAADAKDNDARRTWYSDIEVDPARRRVYVTSRRTRELIAFDYDGKELARIAGPGNAIAVFPDGRVAVSGGDGYHGDPTIQVYDAELKPLRAVTAQYAGQPVRFLDIEADASGRLYAASSDPAVTFVRWSADLEQAEAFGPRYARIDVTWPAAAAVAGEALRIAVAAAGRPAPPEGPWQVLLRDGDGADLAWRPLDCRLEAGVLQAAVPAEVRGPCEVAVRCGAGPIEWGGRRKDLYLQRSFCFAPPGAVASVAIYTESGRRVFRAGKAVALRVACRAEKPARTNVRVALEAGGEVLASAAVAVEGELACELPAALTRRLPPGRYVLRPAAEGYEPYPLEVTVAPDQPDSPLQRILYHEFGEPPATTRNAHLADVAEEKAYLRDYVDAVARLGFTRETDRLGSRMVAENAPQAWPRDRAPADLAAPAFAPAEHYAAAGAGYWQAEQYLDLALAHGIRYDTQFLGHCDGVRFRDWHLRRYVPALQRVGQWLGRFPAFYGFNYNDEMFFGGWGQGWTADDVEWLKQVQEGPFAGRSPADVKMHALRVMYGAFNRAVRQACPGAKITTTPMWQFPAVEGSYPPVIYEGMDESYSHFLSEGYQYPWYPAHSVEFLRRPGLPVMGVFDNGYRTEGADLYAKNLMQVLARGVQGAGVQHTQPFEDAWGASAFRVANRMAAMFGGIFAEAPPANEAAVLYSYTQDITEKRNSIGTPG